MKYRSRTEIITTILETAKAGTTKTKIMYNAYLSYSQLVEYMRVLQENGMLTYEKGKHLYRITEKGSRFLSASHEISDLMGKPENDTKPVNTK